MTKYIIVTNENEDIALNYLAEQQQTSIEDIIERLFKMIRLAYEEGI
jgi:hypothetical protein